MQQINFYLPEFQPNREPFRSAHIFIAALLLIVLLVATTINSIYSNRELEQKLITNKGQVENLKGQLQQYAKISPQTNIIELDNQIFRLKTDIARKQQLLQVIAYQRLGNNTGFSAQLETMSRQSDSTIALTIFSLKSGGSYLELVGQATAAERLPAYIQGLKTEASFKDISFGVVDIEPDKSGLYQFVVAHSAEPSKEAVSAVQVYVKENEERAIP